MFFLQFLYLGLTISHDLILASDAIESGGFRVIYNKWSRREDLASIAGHRDTPSGSITIQARVGLDRGTPLIKTMSVSGMYRGYRDSTPSGLVIGSDLRYIQPKGHLYLSAVSRYEEVHLAIHLDGSDAKGFYKAPDHEWTADIAFAERLARHAMANAAGIRLGEPSRRSFGAYSATGATCSRTGKVLVDLAELASAKGWILTANEAQATYSLRKGDHWALLPLGSDRVKIDGVWKRLDDLLMQKGGRRFVSRQIEASL